MVAVAAVAGDGGFEDVEGLSIGDFDGSGEWTANIGWMSLVVVVGVAEAVVAGRDLSGGRD